MMFIFASLAEGSLHDDEFSKAFLLLNDEIKNGYPDADKATDLAFLCCDNLYRRIVNSASLGESGILFDGDSIASGNVPLILTSQLADGDYNPTETIYGKFQVLECKDCERTIAELKEQYDRKFELTDEEKIWFLSCRKNTMYQQKHRRLWTRLSTAPCGFSLV